MAEQKEWTFPTHIIAVGGIVLNRDGNVLLIKHHRRGWTFPGGVAENGESLPQALRREVMEETGVEIAVESLVCLSSNTMGHEGYGGVKYVPTKLMADFVCRAVGGVPRPSEENSESGYFTLDQAAVMIKTPAEAMRFSVFMRGEKRPVYLEYVTRPEFELRSERVI